MDNKLKRLQDLCEGIYDKNIFKAVFITGSPASGKSTLSRALVIKFGVRIVDSDPQLELMMHRTGIPLDMDLHTDDQKLQTAVLRELAKNMRNKDLVLKSNNALPIVIPTNLDDRIFKKIDDMENSGYETHVIFLDLPLEESIRRNRKRKRKVYDDVIIEAWHKSHDTALIMSNKLGSKFEVIDGNIPTEKVNFTKLTRFYNAPIANPKAQAWIQLQLMLKNQTEQPVPQQKRFQHIQQPKPQQQPPQQTPPNPDDSPQIF